MIAGKALQKAVAQEVFSAPLTFDGVTNLIQDVKLMGRKPYAIVLSEKDRRGLNQDTMGQSTTPVLLADQNNDAMQIAFVEGVQVGWNRNVSDGKCIVLCKPVLQ